MSHLCTFKHVPSCLKAQLPSYFRISIARNTLRTLAHPCEKVQGGISRILSYKEILKDLLVL
jgi:hypothetical protein